MYYLRLTYAFIFALACDSLTQDTNNHEIPFNIKGIAGFRVPNQADNLQPIPNQGQQHSDFSKEASSPKKKQWIKKDIHDDHT